MIELENKTFAELDESLLNTIAGSLTIKEIELIITTNDDIQIINHQYRDVNKATDVLSFPYDEMPMAPLGSIVISSEYAQNMADELGHTLTQEITLLFIHGLLHLLGFDHEVDNGEMREEEARLINKYKLPESLIIRTQG
ncbi:rRNA maturation RNase YbeY [Sulfurimonas sp.]|jgi:probable rRNA maturation factor|uniref:rRNA maturation RNase YbeY n=1 Tax=Sulfurimonas sp. TaxID=2022749 RepID=UPI0025E25331|nr:rRNA maturation RNase YbeY [Sulfurimonas sp.]MBT5935687.1 rRNA maturation RNase YbeY [Sulfurimonas sp.]